MASRLGKSNWAKFQTPRVLLIPNRKNNDCLFIINMTKLEFVFKYLSAILFVFIGKIINRTAIQLMK